jgi:hypothetical protein
MERRERGKGRVSERGERLRNGIIINTCTFILSIGFVTYRETFR